MVNGDLLFEYEISVVILENEEWEMISEDNFCINEAQIKSDPILVTNVTECANQCKGATKKFAHGTNDFEGHGCKNGLCKCQCVNEISNEKCQQANQKDYWFFKYKETTQINGV